MSKRIVQSQNNPCLLKIQRIAHDSEQELITPEGVCSKSGYVPKAVEGFLSHRITSRAKVSAGISEAKSNQKSVKNEDLR